MKLRSATKLFSILFCLSVTDAVRGGKSLRRGGESLPQHNARRRAELKVFEEGAARKNPREGEIPQETVVESYDDPEEAVGGGNKGGGKTKGSKTSREGNANGLPELDYDSEDTMDEEPVDQEPVYGDSEDIAEDIPVREGGKQGGKNKGAQKTSREGSGSTKDSGATKDSGTAKGEGMAEEEEEILNEPGFDSEDVYLIPDDPEASEPEPEQDNPDDPLAGFPPLEQSKSPLDSRK
jgi:hypothetical protein